ncbi:NAD(P)-binding domain-containing protein [Nocardia ninae]|uniref:6-phosphogluconate dehydrogenase n=1 Tax=Nocardia ninae NBRC 108245 TaxID=1210091 RepID=A0A511M991_9NOCA|nr:NAD(P)-binding domain-containing protein [Nocardia ninae]GEM37169.1 6-phosphogluconate dehydrogenase [Nocardia ninae NBRC 108245]
MTSDHTPVTVLGLGRMGAATAQVFLRNGHPVTVWNRSPDRAPHLDGLGAVRADSLTDALKTGELIVISVPETAIAVKLLHTAPEAIAGRTVVNLSTGRPSEARDLEAWIAEQGGRFLDGSILGMAETMGTADSTIIYSGSAEASADHHAVIAELGTAKHLGTEVGLAAVHDLAILAGMYGLFGGFFQAAAMLSRANRNAADPTGALLVPWLHSVIDTLPALAAQIDDGVFPPTMASVEEHQFILRMLLATNREQDLPTDLLDPLLRWFDAGVEHGLGADSLTRVVPLLLGSPARP